MDEEYKMGDAVLGRITKEKDLGHLVLTYKFPNNVRLLLKKIIKFYG